MQRRSLITLASTTALGLVAPTLRAQSLTPLRFSLDFRVTGQTAPFFLAQAKGYYKDEGLDVTIDVGSGSVASITRVASGAYDLSLGDISALIEFNAANPGAPYLSAVYQYYNRAPLSSWAARTAASPTTFAASRASASPRLRWNPPAEPGPWWARSWAWAPSPSPG
jgi:hypothetical protein